MHAITSLLLVHSGFVYFIKAYQTYLTSIDEEAAGSLNASIHFLQHSSFIVELFTDKHVIYNTSDSRLSKLLGVLRYFGNWECLLKQSLFYTNSGLTFNL